uniref:Uncharacterized protein n=1 Tax=Plectus sambesii TaxID=2011161 RepID=A0A914XFB1_9BILA
MYFAQKYLAMFYQAELVNIATNDESPFKKLNERKGPEWNALLNIFVPKMIEWNVSFSMLRDMFHEKFRMFYDFEAWKSFSVYESNQISYIGDSEICYVIGLSGDEHNASNLDP